MSDRIQISIEARENASRVFGQVGAAAGRMGDQVEDAGESFETMERSSQNAGRSLRDMDRELNQIARGMGVLGAGVALAGQSFRDQEIALDTLRRTYGESADELIAFSEAIQDTTNFSNDAAIAAANSFGTLARNYSLTAAEIQNLISVTADLAATKGIGLVDAANRVQAAIRGEAESAEYLGLTLNQMAIDHDNVTFSMSNAEAAQFRLNAVMTQSTFAMGAAEAQAQGTYGALVDIRDSVQDAAQSFGDFLGPLGEVGAFAADNAIQLGVMGLALRELANSALAANAVMGASGLLGTLTRYGRLAGVGVGLAAVAADLLMVEEAGADAAEMFEAASPVIDAFRESMDALAETSPSDALVSLGDDIAESFEYFELLFSRFNELQDLGDDRTAEQEASFGKLQELIGNTEVAATQLVPALVAVDEIMNNIGPAADDARADLAELDEQLDSNEITFEQFLDGAIGIADGLGEANRAAREAAAGQGELNTVTEDYIGLLYRQNQLALADDLAAAQERNAQAQIDAMQGVADALAEAQEAWQEYADAALEAVQAVDSASELFDTLQRTIIGNTDAIASQFDGLLKWADGLIAVEGEYSKLDDLLSAGRITTESYTQAQLAYNDIAAQTAQVQEDVFAIQAKLAPALGAAAVAYGEQVHAISLLRGEALLLQVGLLDATEQQRAFDLATAAANASTNAQVQSIQGMITSAANADPVLAALLDDMGLIEAEIDDVTGEVKSIRITGEGFDTVGNQMDELIASIESLTDAELLLVATLDDDPFTNTADDVRAKLDALDGEVAQATLAAEDDATPKVVEAEAAFGNFSGKDWTVTIGVDSTEIDNFLGSGAAGFPMGFGGPSGGGPEIKASVSVDKSQFDTGMADASSRLSAFSGETGTATADATNDAALAAIDAASDSLSGWDGSTGTANINANDNASGTISSVSSALSALNGRTATTYINTVYTTTYQTIGVPSGVGRAALGGVIDSYADGGVVARMAENGPELLHFPMGGVAIAPSPGVYNVPRGTYVDPAPATAHKLNAMGGGFTFVNQGTIIGIPDLERQIARTISEGLQRANQIHRSSFA